MTSAPFSQPPSPCTVLMTPGTRRSRPWCSSSRRGLSGLRKTRCGVRRREGIAWANPISNQVVAS